MLRLFLVVGILPKFGVALFRNVGDTARFYTGPHLQKKTTLASDVLTKLELSANTRTWICCLIRVLALFASK
jgi:4-hydroxy-3-methylbut-2-en-1-yl diphosphate synthase IspG/GcpE